MRISDWSSDVCSSDLAAEAVDAAVFEAHGDDAAADLAVRAIFHDQVEREIFDEEVGVIFQRLLIERVKHRVAGAVGRRGGALHRDRKSTRLHSSHSCASRMPSSA